MKNENKNYDDRPWLFVVGFFLCVPIFLVAVFGMKSSELTKMENNILVLQDGQITEGIITRTYFMKGAPTGWAVNFTYEVNGIVYSGKAYGPKKMYGGKKLGESVNVLYARKNPRINREIEFFINYPGNKEFADQLGFGKEFSELMDMCEYTQYSLDEWIRQLQKK
jgi:hypothetical protein